MGKKKLSTEKNDRYARILGNNIRRIYERYSTSMWEFYAHYLYPMTDRFKDDMKEDPIEEIERSKAAFKQDVKRYIDGKQEPTLEELVMFSKLAGVSINELLTEELDLDKEPKTLRDILIVLFTLLDRMHFKTYEVTSRGVKGCIITPKLKPTNVTDPDYNDFVFGHIINEFLKEYREQKRNPIDDYRLWRQQIIRGAFGYTTDGRVIEDFEPNDEIIQIVERAKESRRKAVEAQFQAEREAEAEREQFLEDHRFCGQTMEEWDAMSEEEREQFLEDHELSRLEAENDDYEEWCNTQVEGIEVPEATRKPEEQEPMGTKQDS